MAPAPNDADERVCIARIASGKDTEALRMLYERYIGKITRYVRRLMPSDRIAVDDVVQDTFVRIFERATQFRGTGTVSSWIYRIAFNCAMDEYRRRTIPMGDALIEANAPPSTAVDEIVDEKMKRRALNNAIMLLDPKYREIVLLKIFQDMTFTEVAAFLKMPVRTVKHRMQKAMQHIHAHMHGRGDG
ncbi:MAG: sigma-70 family RNA polymerase sigma factor [Spirochaetota bacterium]